MMAKFRINRQYFSIASLGVSSAAPRSVGDFDEFVALAQRIALSLLTTRPLPTRAALASPSAPML